MWPSYELSKKKMKYQRKIPRVDLRTAGKNLQILIHPQILFTFKFKAIFLLLSGLRGVF